MQPQTFFGKYRATVQDNNDPLGLGRIRMLVPDILADLVSGWALPCLPVTGNQLGIFGLPPVGGNVWAEFEQGDPSYPIWTGGWFGDGELPSEALNRDPQLQNILLQTSSGHRIVISDSPGNTGGIRLISSQGATVSINDTGITLDNGTGATVSLSGPTVDVNNQALTVT